MAIEIAGYGLWDPLPYIGLRLWDIGLFLGALIIGIIVVRIASYILKKAMLRAKMTEILADFMTRVMRIILYVFVVGVALGFLGVNIGAALVSVSVVLGFVLGFALGDSLSNIAAGFMIAITKPFAKGDYVTVSGESGVIKTVGISVTELDTVDNKHVIIPNKGVWGGNIVNFTRNNTRRVDLVVGVGYDDDLDKVIKVTNTILANHAKILKDPAPQVAVSEMADSSVNLVVRPWVRTEDYWDVFFDLQKSIKQAYDNEDIMIPFPQRDVHLFKEE